MIACLLACLVVPPVPDCSLDEAPALTVGALPATGMEFRGTADFDWTLDVLLGARAYEEDEWAPVDSQLAFGLLATRRFGDGGWSGELGLFRSSDDATLTNGVDILDVEAEFLEATVAARYTFDLSETAIEPYACIGLSWQEGTISADLNGGGPGDSAEESDSSLGFLFGAGVAFPFAERWRVGVDIRAVVGTDLEYSGASTNADYGQAGLFVGVAF